MHFNFPTIKTKVEAIMLAEIWVNLQAANDGLNRLLKTVIPELKKNTNTKEIVKAILQEAQNYHAQSKMLSDISKHENISFNQSKEIYEKFLMQKQEAESTSLCHATDLLETLKSYSDNFIKLNNILESKSPDSPEYNQGDPLEDIYKELNQAINKTNGLIQNLESDNQKHGLIHAIEDNAKFCFEEAKKLHDQLRTKYIEKIGFPIAFAKNTAQAEYIINFLNKVIEEGREKEFIDGIINEKKIFNFVTKPEKLTQIPKLQSLSDQEFWGNENPSVSGMLLSIIANMYGIYDHKLAIGIGHFHPFFNPDFKLHESLHTTFTNHDGQMCFGTYQFGGGRYAKNPNQDCSSSVGRALDIGEKVLSFNTKSLHAAYADPDNEYQLTRVTSNTKEEIFDYESLKKGDIYLCGSHCSIIVDIAKIKIEGLEYRGAAEHQDENNYFIKTWEFNRDIDSWLDVEKGLKEPNDILRPREGAGECQIDLSAKVKEGKEVYILRKPNQELVDIYPVGRVIELIEEEFNKIYYAPEGYDTHFGNGNFKLFLAGMEDFKDAFKDELVA